MSGVWQRLTVKCVLGGAAVLIACTADKGGREVSVTQRDEDCTPASITAARGEQLKFVVRNESGKDKEIEGIEGTKFEEIVVPKGRTRTVSWGAPNSAGSYKLKCYLPGGANTIITIEIS